MGSAGNHSSRKAFLAIGMDVGSTTVKAIVVDPETKAILWSDYQRHHTKQPEKVLELLEAILAALPGSAEGCVAHLPHRLRLRAALRSRPAASSSRK